MKVFNKTTKTHLWFVLLGLSMTLCRGEDQTTSSSPKSLPATTSTVNSINREFLCQHWVHSYEEDQPGAEAKTFRPAKFKKFPPSRFRMAYKLASDGTCEWLRLAPNDAHRFQTAEWHFNTNDPAMLQITSTAVSMTFHVTSLTNDLLRLRRIDSSAGK